MRKYNLTLPNACLSSETIAAIAASKNAEYLGDTQIPVRPTPEGARPDWSSHPVALFWQADPPTNFANLFVAWRKMDNKLYIAGPNGFDGVVEAVYTTCKPWYVSYSAYGHDFHAIGPSSSICVDGGRDYMRIVGERGEYAVGKLDLITRTLYDSDGEPIGECKVKERKTR